VLVLVKLQFAVASQTWVKPAVGGVLGGGGGVAGTTLIVCPSTAPQVALDLDSIDPDQPDGRPMIVADPPGFALHLWNGTTLVSHADTAEDHNILARYEEKLQPLVQMLAEEKRQQSEGAATAPL